MGAQNEGVPISIGRSLERPFAFQKNRFRITGVLHIKSRDETHYPGLFQRHVSRCGPRSGACEDMVRPASSIGAGAGDRRTKDRRSRRAMADGMSEHEPVPMARASVFIVDDDAGLRASLENLLRSAGFAARGYASPEEFIREADPAMCGCVLLDIQFPGASGLDFQTPFREAGIAMPVILMTGHADVPTSVRGLKAGAVDYLMKPFDEAELLGAVRLAMDRDMARCEQEAGVNAVADRYATLTQREKEVLAYVALGLMNKQIANRIDLSEITVKVHRGTMMKKLAVRTVADLVRAFEILKAHVPDIVTAEP